MSETVLNQPEVQASQIPETKHDHVRLKRMIGILLSLIMLGLTMLVLNMQHQNSALFEHASQLALNAGNYQASNYRSYVQQYKDTRIQLEETSRKLEEVNRQLDAVTLELSTTKGMLNQTQDMLAQAQAENAKLKEEIQGIASIQQQENVANVQDLQLRINDLKQKNTQVSGQLALLKEQLHAFEADFSNYQEGRTLITLFQNKIKLVKSRMSYLKQEAYFAKVAAQKEKDRIALLNGNNGFVLKNGTLQKPGSKSFNIDVKVVQ